jgi:CheY-like chemotaxis protein
MSRRRPSDFGDADSEKLPVVSAFGCGYYSTPAGDTARVNSGTPVRILVVEDEILIQMLAVQYLEDAGFVAETADSAAEALDKLQSAKGEVSAIVLDIGLPDRSGDMLTREIRAIYPSVPIVLATGHLRSDFNSVVDGNRGIAFLSKPYSADSLISALREAGVPE